MIRGIYIAPEQNEARERCVNDIAEIKEILGCSVLGYMRSSAAGCPVLVAHDDSAWKKEGLRVSAVNRTGASLITGKIFVMGCDGLGECDSLSAEQLSSIFDEVIHYEYRKNEECCCIRLLGEL